MATDRSSSVLSRNVRTGQGYGPGPATRTNGLKRIRTASERGYTVPMKWGMTVAGTLVLSMTACLAPGEQASDEEGGADTMMSQPTSNDGNSFSTSGTSSTNPGATSGGSTSIDPDTATTVEPPKLDLAAIPDAPEGSTGTTGEPVDCDALLPLPVTYTTVSGPTSTEDFVFDANGYLLNVANGGDLLRAEYGASSTLLFPGVGNGFAAGTAMRANGDVVFNANNQVRRIATDGSVEVIAAGLSYPNGLTVGMNDLVYVAEQSGNRVVSIDPVSLDVDVVADGLYNPNGLAFDRSYENLYVGSFGGGTVHQINIASGAVQVYAENIGGGGLDGLIVDACDNVYVTDYGPGLVWRVEGNTHDLVVDLPSGWIPNMHFGSGHGGWDPWRLYVMDIGGDQLYELDLGVPGISLPQL